MSTREDAENVARTRSEQESFSKERYEVLLESLSQKVAGRLIVPEGKAANSQARGHRALVLTSLVVFGIAYGVLLARVVANPEIWSGLTAVVVALVGGVSVIASALRSGKVSSPSAELRTEAAVLTIAGSIGFLVGLCLIDWGYMAGGDASSIATNDLRQRVDRHSHALAELNEKLQRIEREEVAGYRQGVLNGEPFLLARPQVGADEILSLSALFDADARDTRVARATIISVKEGRRFVRDVRLSSALHMYFWAKRAQALVVQLEITDGELPIPFRAAWSIREGKELRAEHVPLQGMLEVGRPVVADVVSGKNAFHAPCAPSSTPERAYQVTLSEPSQLTMWLDAGFQAWLSLAQVDEKGALVPLTCESVYPRGLEQSPPSLSMELPAGQYAVVVEGRGNNQGDFSLTVAQDTIAGSCLSPILLSASSPYLPALIPGARNALGTLEGNIFVKFRPDISFVEIIAPSTMPESGNMRVRLWNDCADRPVDAIAEGSPSRLFVGAGTIVEVSSSDFLDIPQMRFSQVN
jgi:hypothetical protein